MSEPNEIGERIRKLREHIGEGRRTFAKSIGIPWKTIENIEHGKQKAYGEHLGAMAKKWPQYALWLLTGQTDPANGQTSPEEEEMRQNLGQEGRAA